MAEPKKKKDKTDFKVGENSKYPQRFRDERSGRLWEGPRINS